MASQPDSNPITKSTGRSIYQTISEVILTGVAIIVPVVVTIYVLTVALSFLDSALQPLVEVLQMTGVFALLEDLGLVTVLVEAGVYDSVIGFLTEIIALVALLGIIVLVGTVAYHPIGERFVDYVDVFIASIPGIGTVYKSFRRMGDIMIDDDVENFQEVKLVELHGEGSYVIGFEVGDSPPVISDAVEENVVTMFVPFVPNPVTGGFLTYVSEARLTDVDMTVDEGIRNVITSGVAGHESEQAAVDLSVDDVQDLLDGEISRPSGLFDETSSTVEPTETTETAESPDSSSGPESGSAPSSSSTSPTTSPSTSTSTSPTSQPTDESDRST
ncbi:DUF502 domain-containing protein [Halobacteria archaeon AArc-m2/3/4]|uniref:DUF502 domain-containing protein n=1 Tax=Natronoglomus mannanivorans TaxID=2979990 RepID=A0ABT2QCP2_9EURY|nr:DUF502 domain-containing protein [Halobacteria archaeon AArc-m2/3/4]